MTRVWVPPLTWQLKVTSDLNYKVSDTFFWPPRAPDMHVVHIHLCRETLTHVSKNKSWKIKTKWRVRDAGPGSCTAARMSHKNLMPSEINQQQKDTQCTIPFACITLIHGYGREIKGHQGWSALLSNGLRVSIWEATKVLQMDDVSVYATWLSSRCETLPLKMAKMVNCVLCTFCSQ